MKKSFILVAFVCVFAFSLMFVSYSNAKVDPKTAFVVWTFGEGSGTTVKDASGNGNNGTFVKSVAWADAKNGKGVTLDGKSTAIQCTTTKNVGSKAFTECLWVKFSDLAPENQFGYISCTGTASARYFYFSTWSSAGAPNDAMHAGTLDTKGAWGRGLSAGRLFKKDQWYFVAASIDTVAGSIKGYVDGKMVQEQKIDPGDVPGTPKEIWVGGSPENYAWVAGTIDDVAFFNAVVSEADLNNIMKNGVSGELNITAVKSADKVASEWGHIKTQ
ncbi:MAG: LamG domain-containing protein [Candidatus Poribacteria bacterium]